MGITTMCKLCGSDWCSGDCESYKHITPKNLRRLACLIPNSGFVGDLRKLADYFEQEPKDLSKALAVMKKEER